MAGKRCGVVVMVPPENKMETSGGHQGRVSALGVSLSADTRERLAPLAGMAGKEGSLNTGTGAGRGSVTACWLLLTGHY